MTAMTTDQFYSLTRDTQMKVVQQICKIDSSQTINITFLTKSSSELFLLLTHLDHLNRLSLAV